MNLKYQTGEEIRRGDRVLFHQNPATIELVARESSDHESAWYVKKFGGGILVLDPMVSGHTFIPVNQLNEYEDLVFVSRLGTE